MARKAQTNMSSCRCSVRYPGKVPGAKNQGVYGGGW